ncbi:MAG TPA: D-glycero-beta-D-manno-heptose-7-phosphate kinase [Candidatus Eremiobacteraceae bacterium]|nr:D-glycero-beta-D-manno-heptose-7-phosphate kinase [Candidatus Eremiobacteraceae bacterium]
MTAREDGRWVSDLLASMRGRRIVVAGDLMLDEWLWGRVRRISPEAPVPVVEVQSHSYTLGGAGNVACNLAALGARVAVVGLVGRDEAATRLLELFKRMRVDARGVTRVAGRTTTQKTRIVAHHQQVVRADRESTDRIAGAVRESLCRALATFDGRVDGVIISDYGKGTVDETLVRTARAYKTRAIVTGDPKPANLAAFSGIDCIAPNAGEAESASGMSIESDADLARAGAALVKRTKCRHVLITRGENGMTLFSKEGRPFTVPAVARQVYDVSGAGDTVVSTLTLAMTAGATIEHAVEIASLAAGVVVEKLGTATATPEEIIAFAKHEGVAVAVPLRSSRSRRAR